MLPTCKEVSSAFARGEYASASFATKLRMRLHLAICWHCRRFRRQIGLIEQALRQVVFVAPGPAAETALQQAVLKRLGSV